MSRQQTVANVRRVLLALAIALLWPIAPDIACVCCPMLFMPTFSTSGPVCADCSPSYGNNFQVTISSIANGDCTNCGSVLDNTYTIPVSIGCVWLDTFTGTLTGCANFDRGTEICNTPFHWTIRVEAAWDGANLTYTGYLVLLECSNGTECAPPNGRIKWESSTANHDCSGLSGFSLAYVSTTDCGPEGVGHCYGVFSPTPLPSVCSGSGSSFALTST